MKKSRAKISKFSLGEGIDKCAVLVHDDTLKKWIPCGTIDEKGLEKIIVFDAEYEAEAFIEGLGHLDLVEE